MECEKCQKSIYIFLIIIIIFSISLIFSKNIFASSKINELENKIDDIQKEQSDTIKNLILYKKI